LYDLAGNVFEWVEDAPPPDEATGETRPQRWLRGGSWTSGTVAEMRLDSRRRQVLYMRREDYGFRCVLDLGAAAEKKP
jgi:formylglycine-generating enzyme required for sulfatase activity